MSAFSTIENAASHFKGTAKDVAGAASTSTLAAIDELNTEVKKLIKEARRSVKRAQNPGPSMAVIAGGIAVVGVGLMTLALVVPSSRQKIRGAVKSVIGSRSSKVDDAHLDGMGIDPFEEAPRSIKNGVRETVRS